MRSYNSPNFLYVCIRISCIPLKLCFFEKIKEDSYPVKWLTFTCQVTGNLSLCIYYLYPTPTSTCQVTDNQLLCIYYLHLTFTFKYMHSVYLYRTFTFWLLPDTRGVTAFYLTMFQGTVFVQHHTKTWYLNHFKILIMIEQPRLTWELRSTQIFCWNDFVQKHLKEAMKLSYYIGVRIQRQNLTIFALNTIKPYSS